MTSGTRSTPHVVIVGGGFAGLTVLNHLRRLLHGRVRITLIDKSPHAVNRPMMPEIAFGGTAPQKSRFPMAPAVVSEDASYFPGVVTAIDTVHNGVHLEDGQSLAYDILVLAPGPVHDYAAVPGLEDFGYSICDEAHASALWQALRGFSGGKVVIGAAPTRHGSRIKAPILKAACEGPVGEAMFMMDHRLRHHGQRAHSGIRVFSPGTEFFDDVGANARAGVGKLTEEAGIDVAAGLEIARVGVDRVEFRDGTCWDSDLSIILPPHAPPAFITASGLGDEAGWIPTDTTMRHLDHGNIYAAGDCTALAQPKMGHIAALQAEVAATAIARTLGADIAAPLYRPEVMCIMNRGGLQATLILSDVLYGGDRDFILSGALPHFMKWSFDAYIGVTRGELPSDWMEKTLEWGLAGARRTPGDASEDATNGAKGQEKT